MLSTNSWFLQKVGFFVLLIYTIYVLVQWVVTDDCFRPKGLLGSWSKFKVPTKSSLYLSYSSPRFGGISVDWFLDGEEPWFSASDGISSGSNSWKKLIYQKTRLNYLKSSKKVPIRKYYAPGVSSSTWLLDLFATLMLIPSKPHSHMLKPSFESSVFGLKFSMFEIETFLFMKK